MALDGIYIYSLANELNSKLKDARVDKIYQPESEELFIHLHKEKEKFKLFLSVASGNPKIYISKNTVRENPSNAPSFCMLLRKILTGGKILKVKQPPFERIIEIHIEVLDELRNKKIKVLTIELMGKHSNIILLDSETLKITDSIKRVPLSLSRVRQIVPGNLYLYPPSQGKINPLDILTFDEFNSSLKTNTSLYKSLYTSFDGIGPNFARELCYRSNVDSDIDFSNLSEKDKKYLFENFSKFFLQIKKNIIHPSIFFNKKIDQLIDYYVVPLDLYSEFTIIYKESLSETLEDFFIQKDIKDRIRQRSSDLKKSIQIKLERLYNKKSKQLDEIEKAKKADSFKLKGDLITSYIYMIEKGMNFINVENFYDENLPKLKINLDSHLTPSENAQKYFKKYNKLKTAFRELNKQIQLDCVQIDYLENILLSLENCQDLNDLEDIVEELKKEDLIKNKKEKNKKSSNISSSPMKFISSSGLSILVGKNNKQNDLLTLKIADIDDLWFHTKDIPGSHVILKINSSKDVDETSIHEAAILAAYYSKARNSSNVAVDFTQRRNVKKPSGAKPGMVIYEKNKTLFVNPSQELITTIKNNKDPE